MFDRCLRYVYIWNGFRFSIEGSSVFTVVSSPPHHDTAHVFRDATREVNRRFVTVFAHHVVVASRSSIKQTASAKTCRLQFT